MTRLTKTLASAGTALALAACCSVGVGTFAYAAGDKAAAETESAWSIELDCTECHAVEAESLGAAAGGAAGDAADDAASVDGKDAEADGAKGDAEAADTKDAEGDADAAAGTLTGKETYAAQHAETFGLTCTDCHEDSDKLASAHKKMDSGKQPKRLKKTAVENDLCLTCHDTQVLAEATVDSAILTDTEGTVINPHDLPTSGTHGDILCVDCHKAHTPSRSLADAANGVCTDCHHAGVFQCGTCHE